jgi:hypothetical protein
LGGLLVVDMPPTAAILKHPVFWSKVSRLSGLLVVDMPPTAAILKHPIFRSKVIRRRGENINTTNFKDTCRNPLKKSEK